MNTIKTKSLLIFILIIFANYLSAKNLNLIDSLSTANTPSYIYRITNNYGSLLKLESLAETNDVKEDKKIIELEVRMIIQLIGISSDKDTLHLYERKKWDKEDYSHFRIGQLIKIDSIFLEPVDFDKFYWKIYLSKDSAELVNNKFYDLGSMNSENYLTKIKNSRYSFLYEKYKKIKKANSYMTKRRLDGLKISILNYVKNVEIIGVDFDFDKSVPAPENKKNELLKTINMRLPNGYSAFDRTRISSYTKLAGEIKISWIYWTEHAGWAVRKRMCNKLKFDLNLSSYKNKHNWELLTFIWGKEPKGNEILDYKNFGKHWGSIPNLIIINN